MSKPINDVYIDMLKESNSDKIVIQKSETADTRSCDFTKVDCDTLLQSSKSHISDVKKGMNFFADMLKDQAEKHDNTKLSHIDMFHKDFANGFKTQEWYTMHKREERHHLAQPDGVRDDVNLIDVLECIVDGVMAGMARTGKYRKEDLQPGVLEKAFNNTIDLLLKKVEVKK